MSRRPSPRDLDRKLLAQVVELAQQNVRAGGRPFACIIADTATGEVLASSGNLVAQTGDPTAHAEMVAIREGSTKLRALGRPVDGSNGAVGEDFAGYSFYILTSPCAMCMAAMEYCGPDAIWYATTREDYCAHYRDDRRYFEMENLYGEVAKPAHEKRLPMGRVEAGDALDVYKMWADTNPSDPAAVSARSRKDQSSASVGGAGVVTAVTTGHGGADAATLSMRLASTLAECPFAAPGARSQAHKLPMLIPTGDIESRRPEVVTADGTRVPAWSNVAELRPIIAARTEAWDRLINIVATRGSATQQLYMAMRDLNTLTREHYAKMIFNVGRNIFPLIVASDYEANFSGIGSTFTLYLADGTSKRIAPAPPVYELYKSLSHMALGVFAIVSPYFRTPGAAGWVAPLTAFQRTVRQSLHDVPLATELPEEVRSHALAMLTTVDSYCSSCISAGTVDPAVYMQFTASLLPLIQKSVMNAARIQAHAAIPELQRWKAELGPLWRDVHVLIPTVWPVSGRNPRQQIFEMLLDADRVATHIIKAEGAKDIEEARTTLGRVVGDRTVAQMVFGTDSADARNLVGALSTPRDIVTSACDDALQLFVQLGGEAGALGASECIMK